MDPLALTVIGASVVLAGVFAALQVAESEVEL